MSNEAVCRTAPATPGLSNIPDSSHRYGSNVTFGASLAFQMREEYVFEEKNSLKIGPQGG